VRLLFDENLSPDLPRALARVFPHSAHVRDLELLGADDSAIWSAAAQQGFVLVTKDDDFVELSILRGAPPKVILLDLGNCLTSDVVALIEKEKAKLVRFECDESTSLLVLP
jgi:predicted nuclease of predicted toxin-antitoxin system